MLCANCLTSWSLPPNPSTFLRLATHPFVISPPRKLGNRPVFRSLSWSVGSYLCLAQSGQSSVLSPLPSRATQGTASKPVSGYSCSTSLAPEAPGPVTGLDKPPSPRRPSSCPSRIPYLQLTQSLCSSLLSSPLPGTRSDQSLHGLPEQ